MPAPTFQPFFLRLGASAVLPDAAISARIAGVPVAGGSGGLSNEAAAYAEAGYYLTRTIALSLAAGSPPVFAATGTGVLGPFGTLYKARVGMPVAEATYHLDGLGPFRPYAGVGVGYAIVFQNDAGTVQSPHLHDRAAFVLVGGIDYDIGDHWGVFVDVKKAFLNQKFDGLAPVPGVPVLLPVSAHIRSDPLVVSSGVTYRF